MQNPPKTAIFDLDGTLLDTLPDLADSVNRTLAAFGLPAHPTEAYKHFVGNGRDNLLRRASGVADPQRLGELIAQYDALYAVHYRDRTRPYDGVADALTALGLAGVRLAVLSNKPHDMTVRLVAECFPGVTFDAVLGQRPDVPLKPDPRAVYEILDLLDCPPERCIYYGDSGVDIRTARAAGVYPCGVLWGFRDKEELEEAGAARLLSHPDELFPAAYAFFTQTAGMN